jgi:hypothetical protein
VKSFQEELRIKRQKLRAQSQIAEQMTKTNLLVEEQKATAVLTTSLDQVDEDAKEEIILLREIHMRRLRVIAAENHPNSE